MQLDIEHREDDHQFVAVLDGHPSYLRYRPVGQDTLDLVSTFVHRQARGRGVGEKLVRSALDYARDRGFQIIPSCWFVETVLERHPEYRELVAD